MVVLKAEVLVAQEVLAVAELEDKTLVILEDRMEQLTLAVAEVLTEVLEVKVL